jgi:hypothetical protein
MILIDDYAIDLALDENLTYESEVTENPVEQGADVTDHVRAKQPVLTFEGVVSDTPIGRVSTHESRLAIGTATPSQDAFQRLVAIHEAREPVVVTCSFGRFDAMVLTSLSPSKNAASQRSLQFSATFRRIQIVENTRTTVRVAVPNCGKKQTFGLSLDRVVKGKQILWRKGRPPGSSPSTDPKGVIIGQEIVHSINGKYLHEDKRTPLTDQQRRDLFEDLNRDARLMQFRTLQRADEQTITDRDRMLAADALQIARQRHPGKHIDPALFGLKPSGN